MELEKADIPSNNIYDSWIEKNFVHLATRALNILLYSQVLMLIVDAVALPQKESRVFMLSRATMIAVSIIGIKALENLGSLFDQKLVLLASFCLALVVFTLMLNFIALTQWSNDFTVAFAIFIPATLYLMHYVPSLMFSFSGFSVVCLATLSLYEPAIRMASMNIITVAVVSSVVFFFQGRLFSRFISKSYESLSQVIPRHLAKDAVIRNQSLGDIDSVAVRESFGVALCSNWREYQKLASDLSSKEISSLFNRYYSKIFSEAEKVPNSVTVFTDWVADELTVIFYPSNAGVTKEDVAQAAFEFAIRLSKETFNVSAIDERYIRFDIGIAAGYGLVGLQGPAGHQKLMMIGAVPGVAKRLETSAKELRAREVDGSIIAVNQEFRDLLYPEQRNDFFAHFSNVKNLEGHTIWYRKPLPILRLAS